jgi:IS30 family transposase
MFLMRAEGKGLRAIGRVLHRDPGTISRELKRNTLASKPYDARKAAPGASTAAQAKADAEACAAVGALRSGRRRP